MPSLIPGFEYDIFISYRHNDNRSGWVTEFVNALQEELASTIKEPLSIYFDKNPHDGLLETHDVDDSLKEKLKCLIFIPIISQTYCDPKSFAWTSEFLVFLKMAADDSIGLKVRLGNGNTSSRLLPIRIHELDARDKKTIETQIGPLRSIDFTYQSSGVNRPLRPKDDESIKGAQSVYRDQINKTANAMEEVFKCADILSLHCPLNESTHHIINKEAIDMIKKGVMIINSSRGGLIDTKAAIYGLKIKQIAYLALDVYEHEGKFFFRDLSSNIIEDDTIQRLMSFPNVLITAHQAFLTEEALQQIASTTFTNVDEILNGKHFSLKSAWVV